MLCTRCRIRTAVTDDGLCTFCSGTRPPLPGGLMAPVPGPGGWGVATWPRSPVGLARAVTALLGVVIAADLFAIGTGLHLRGLWQQVEADGALNVYVGDGRTAETLYGIAALSQGVALLATGVVFIIWFHRTRRNAEVFDPSVQRMGPGWAVGGWFVPIANLWFPYRVASGVWEASAQTRPDGGRRTVPRTPLNLWWGAWVVSLLFTRVTERLWDRAVGAEEVVRAAGLVAASDAVDIVAAALAVLYVRAVTRMQVERALHGRAPDGPAPAPVPGAHR
ncbi:hypothetical protein WQO_22150 [Streptomyces globisporus C-1027]|uniref:DUF4328 domain-containing protein n=1 Tax=Streptomyces globisporus C-1027 TaxID=1172567 RepID=A0A0U3D5I7_STRGL|nr:DUF4328 domain-containing protein [Streptomyces globisporus]ALU95780.1 hypothetical protein WQO_22150 [Streptomyces globisporus C-1027]